jgi:hypothetical protein
MLFSLPENNLGAIKHREEEILNMLKQMREISCITMILPSLSLPVYGQYDMGAVRIDLKSALHESAQCKRVQDGWIIFDTASLICLTQHRDFTKLGFYQVRGRDSLCENFGPNSKAMVEIEKQGKKNFKLNKKDYRCYPGDMFQAILKYSNEAVSIETVCQFCHKFLQWSPQEGFLPPTTFMYGYYHPRCAKHLSDSYSAAINMT